MGFGHGPGAALKAGPPLSERRGRPGLAEPCCGGKDKTGFGGSGVVRVCQGGWGFRKIAP